MVERDDSAIVTIKCQHSTHFSVEPGGRGVARVYCRNRRCKLHADEITIHHFDLATGELLETRRYARPSVSGATTLQRVQRDTLIGV